jgi:hypothetical protein
MIMKNFTFTVLIFFSVLTMMGQTYSTGTITLATDYNAKIDVDSNSNLVTLTLNGPSDRYFALGFGVLNMLNTGDCVIYAGAAGLGTSVLTDRTYNNSTTLPSLDSGTNTQSWNVTTNSVVGSTRTIIATRQRVSTGDFTFPTIAGSLNLAWSKGDGAGYNLVYHGSNRGGTTVSYLLGNQSFSTESFKMYPNPAKGFTTIELPAAIDLGAVKIYDNLGRVVRNQIITTTLNTISTEGLTNGTYMVVIRTDYGNATKILLVQ